MHPRSSLTSSSSSSIPVFLHLFHLLLFLFLVGNSSCDEGINSTTDFNQSTVSTPTKAPSCSDHEFHRRQFNNIHCSSSVPSNGSNVSLHCGNLSLSLFGGTIKCLGCQNETFRIQVTVEFLNGTRMSPDLTLDSSVVDIFNGCAQSANSSVGLVPYNFFVDSAMNVSAVNVGIDGEFDGWNLTSWKLVLFQLNENVSSSNETVMIENDRSRICGSDEFNRTSNCCGQPTDNETSADRCPHCNAFEFPEFPPFRSNSTRSFLMIEIELLLCSGNKSLSKEFILSIFKEKNEIRTKRFSVTRNDPIDSAVRATIVFWNHDLQNFRYLNVSGETLRSVGTIKFYHTYDIWNSFLSFWTTTSVNSTPRSSTESVESTTTAGSVSASASTKSSSGSPEQSSSFVSFIGSPSFSSDGTSKSSFSSSIGSSSLSRSSTTLPNPLTSSSVLPFSASSSSSSSLSSSSSPRPSTTMSSSSSGIWTPSFPSTSTQATVASSSDVTSSLSPTVAQSTSMTPTSSSTTATTLATTSTTTSTTTTMTTTTTTSSLFTLSTSTVTLPTTPLFTSTRILASTSLTTSQEFTVHISEPITFKPQPFRLTNEIYSETLKDNYSRDYIRISGYVRPKLEQICEEIIRDKFRNVSDLRFSPGSVIVNSTLDLLSDLTEDEKNRLNNAIQNGFQDPLNIVAVVVGSVIGLILILIVILVSILCYRWWKKTRLPPVPGSDPMESSEAPTGYTIHRPPQLLWQSSVGTSSLTRRHQSGAMELSIHGNDGGESYVGKEDADGGKPDVTRTRTGFADPVLKHYASPDDDPVDATMGWKGAIPRPELDIRVDRKRPTEAVFPVLEAVNGYHPRPSGGEIRSRGLDDIPETETPYDTSERHFFNISHGITASNSQDIDHQVFPRHTPVFQLNSSPSSFATSIPRPARPNGAKDPPPAAAFEGLFVPAFSPNGKNDSSRDSSTRNLISGSSDRLTRSDGETSGEFNWGSVDGDSRSLDDVLTHHGSKRNIPTQFLSLFHETISRGSKPDYIHRTPPTKQSDKSRPRLSLATGPNITGV